MAPRSSDRAHRAAKERDDLVEYLAIQFLAK